MKLENVFSELKIDKSLFEAISGNWEESIATQPESIPEFLQPENFMPCRAYCSIEPEVDNALTETARAINENPALSAFSWHLYCQHQNHEEIKTFSNWPLLTEVLEKKSGLLYLLIALATVPVARRKFESMGIPENIIKDTCHQLKNFCNNYRVSHDNQPGIIPRQIAWLRNYMKGRLFRLGRMEYRLERYPNTPNSFRNKKTGNKILFANDGTRFDGEGYVDGINGVFDEKNGWAATFLIAGDTVAGYPISPYGYALNEKITLALKEWEKITGPDDLLIDMHIPSGGGLSLAACEDSMRRAVQFFKNYFPDQKTRAIFCASWLFNTQFEEKLPDSNLTKFMRELYLFPIKSSGKDGFFFVFCRDYEDLPQAPRKTSLHRVMLDTLESGKNLRSGGMVFFNEDLNHFGEQYYRTKWDN